LIPPSFLLLSVDQKAGRLWADSLWFLTRRGHTKEGIFAMLLLDLVKELDPQADVPDSDKIEITGVQEDSRLVEPGNVFIARPGTKTDGAKFIADAIERRAAAIVTQSKAPSCPVPQLIVPDTGAAASILANAAYGYPARTVKTFAVTGTNGKTTTTYLVRHLLKKLNRKCGIIGTVEIDNGKTCVEAQMTTPSATDVARLLATMRDNGCWSCAMETSSHALDQGRVAGIDFVGAAFTNLTGDHLDYHKTMDHYAASKARLFEQLHTDAVAVYNADDSWSVRMIRDTHARCIGFGIKTPTDYTARDISITSQGSSFILHTPDGQAPVQMALIGRHNIENALTAAALVGEVFHVSVHQIASGLSDALGAPGRLQAVRLGQPFAVLVDYAHTDDALDNVLSALRPLSRKSLRVVFGCGGDRDRTKRPRMARTAVKWADAIYITSDNPRTENPQAILDEIVTGLPPRSEKKITIEADRRRAIELAIGDATAGDVVLIAGKGHENYQILGTTKHHFDDVEEAMRVLQQRIAA